MNNCESFLEMAIRHRALDLLAQGEWKTCSVGCFNKEYGNAPADIKALSKSTGYPVWVHRLQERLFEYLPENCALDWHVQFADKMLTIKDFKAFYHSFMVGVLKIVLPHDKHDVVQPVIDLHTNYSCATPEDWVHVRYQATKAEHTASGRPSHAALTAKVAGPKPEQSWHSGAEPAAAEAVWTFCKYKIDRRRPIKSQTVYVLAWQKIRYAFLNAYGGE